MTSFFMMGAQEAVGEKNQLVQLEKTLDWRWVEKKLKGIHLNDINPQGGPKGYNKLAMFKAMLLGQWHSLSDQELENSLRVRLDFMVFTGLELGNDFPDSSTLCRFRNKLMEKKLLEKLFREVNRQLEQSGLAIQKSRGAVVDATIIESAAHPRRTIEVDKVPKDRNESETSYKYQDSADVDARWLKKGKRCYFGYKGFIRTTEGKGFIQHIEVEPANVSELKQLDSLTKKMSSKILYGDKGYACEENNRLLSQRKIKNRVMFKAARNRSLTKKQKLFNRLVSKKRFIVEQAFGTLKRRFQFTRASYFGLEKVKGQFYLKAMCFNLLKAMNLCFST